MEVTEVLRNAIRKSDKPAMVIAKESGVPQATLSRFLNGSHIGSAHVDTLAAYFGLVLKKVRGKK